MENQSLGVVAVRFGAAMPEPISKERSELYERLTECLGAYKLSDVGHALTLSISLGELEEKDRLVYDRLLDQAEAYQDFPNLLLIDVIPPRETLIPGKVEIHIANAVVALSSKHADARFLLLIDRMPPKKEVTRRVLEVLVKAGRVVLIDSTGKMVGKGFGRKLSNLLSADLVLLRRRASGHNQALLELKMSRRLGHFRRPSEQGAEVCLRYFYDGSHCVNEIASLLQEYVGDLAVTCVLFDCTVSSWLKGAVERVAATLSVPARDIRSILSGKEVFSGPELDRAILVLPLVDTGRTISILLEKWISLFGSSTLPRIFSVLSTQNSENRIRVLAVKRDLDVSIRFMMYVARGLEQSSRCSMCELGVPHSDYAQDDFQMLTSYDFWTMADEVGWQEEESVPGNRAAMATVPNFPEMFRENGAWLALKAARRLIQAQIGDFPTEPFLLICPEEEGAKVLASYLEALHEGISVLPIPRQALEAWRGGDLANEREYLELWRGSRWFAQLQKVTGSSKIVAVEEFSVSGGTLRAMNRLVNWIGQRLTGHLAIVDFSPSREKGVKLDTLCLYSFDGA